MKKSVKVTLIVAAALVGLGLCLAVAGLAMGGRFSDLRNLHLDPATGQWEQTKETRDQTGDYTGSDYYLPAGTSITALDIDWISGEAEILVTNDADILVREQPERGISASYAMVVTEQDGVLKVRYAADEFLTLPDLPPKKLVVRLPRAVAENLTEVQLNSVSADFDVAALTVKEALIFDSVSGDLETDFITADSAEVNTVSGKIDLDGSFRQVTGGSTSGEVDLALRKCPDKIELTTVSGDVDLELPRNAGFTLDYSTVFGDLESDFPLTAGRTYGDGSGSITIDTTSGDLKIENLD